MDAWPLPSMEALLKHVKISPESIERCMTLSVGDPAVHPFVYVIRCAVHEGASRPCPGHAEILAIVAGVLLQDADANRSFSEMVEAAAKSIDGDRPMTRYVKPSINTNNPVAGDGEA
jgi:hypothetical protein